MLKKLKRQALTNLHQLRAAPPPTSVTSRKKENNGLQEKPKSRSLDADFVALFFLFVGAAGVHFVGRMANSQRFALMTAMGGVGCGLIAGYAIGVSDRDKK